MKPGSWDAVVGSRSWKHDALLKKHAFAVKSYAAKKKKDEKKKPAAVDLLKGAELKGKLVALKKDVCIAMQPMTCSNTPRYIDIFFLWPKVCQDNYDGTHPPPHPPKQF